LAVAVTKVMLVPWASAQAAGVIGVVVATGVVGAAVVVLVVVDAAVVLVAAVVELVLALVEEELHAAVNVTTARRPTKVSIFVGE
jgi:hypothetical protein